MKQMNLFLYFVLAEGAFEVQKKIKLRAFSQALLEGYYYTLQNLKVIVNT